MPDLGDLEKLAGEAKNLIDDHGKEIKQGLDKAADLVEKDQHGTAHDVAGAADGLVDEVSDDKKPKAKKSNAKKSNAKKSNAKKSNANKPTAKQ